MFHNRSVQASLQIFDTSQKLNRRTSIAPMWEKQRPLKTNPRYGSRGKKHLPKKLPAFLKRGVSLFLLQYLGRVSSAKNWFTQPITLASVSVFSDILCFHTLVGNMTGMFVDARYSTNKYQQHIFGQIIIFHQPRFPWSKWNSFPKSYRNGWGKSVVFWMGDAFKVQEAFLANSTKHGVLTLLMYLFFLLIFCPILWQQKIMFIQFLDFSSTFFRKKKHTQGFATKNVCPYPTFLSTPPSPAPWQQCAATCPRSKSYPSAASSMGKGCCYHGNLRGHPMIIGKMLVPLGWYP